MPAVSRSYSLDNAAKAWPTVISRRQTSRFRLFAVLHQPLVWPLLERSVAITEKRFPWFKVRLRSGFFWYHLQTISDPLPILPDRTPPCLFPDFNDSQHKPKNQPLLSVHVFQRSLGVEASHVLTDGSGLSEFFRTLVGVYCGLVDSRARWVLTQSPEDIHGILPQTTWNSLLDTWEQELDSLDWKTLRHPHESAGSDEWVDEFVASHLTGLPSPPVPSKALHLPVRLLPQGDYRVSHALIPVSQLKDKTAKYGVRLGEYLSAAVLMAFQLCVEDVPLRKRKGLMKRPLRLLVPIDLRRMHGSRTLRNFLVGMSVEIDLRLGHYRFDEILTRVHHVQRTELAQKYLGKQVARNVKGEALLILRLMPLILKNPVLRWIFLNLGDKRHTASFSNLGLLDFPSWGEKHIDWIGLVPPPGVISPLNVTAVSTAQTLCLTVGKTTGYSRFEYYLFRIFADQGITPRVWTNFTGG